PGRACPLLRAAFPASPRPRVSASCLLPLLLLLSAPAPAQNPAGATNALPVTFRPGDRVILAGPLAETLAQDGTFETLLQSRVPELKLNLRTPALPADAATGLPPAATLLPVLRREQAEVVFLFPGAAATEAALDALCGEILAQPFSRRGTARLVLVTGPAAAPAPLREVAARHGAPLLDLGRAFRAAALRPDADAGEPTAWALAHVLLQELRLALPEATLALDADDLRFGSRVGAVRRSQRDGLARMVDLMDVPLPSPPPPDGRRFPGVVPDHRRLVRVTSLEQPARWTLSLDGEPLVTAAANDWAAGIPVASALREARAERLRRAVVRKHELYRAGAPELGEAEVEVWELSVLSPEIRYRISLAPAVPDQG
ncbi:MAG TPA: hypothetical protein PKE47_13085, partial [Verrucomicrobiota bacterium]|nr:hypothetical protein [Verrucomicrobiota bacterium]